MILPTATSTSALLLYSTQSTGGFSSRCREVLTFSVSVHLLSNSDVNKDWTHKDKDKDQTLKDQDKD